MITLGNILDGTEQRDAIHIAIVPVIANEKLAPGQDAGFVEPGNTEIVGISDSPIGIVDPFLKALVFPGQKCWMLMYPNTITSLRHEWEHPAFQGVPEPNLPNDISALPDSVSVSWLRDFAAVVRMTYEDLLLAADDYLRNGAYVFAPGDSEAARDHFYDNRVEFWRNFEAATGRRVPDEDKEGGFFTCSC